MIENSGAVLISKEPIKLPSAEAECDLTELAEQFAVDATHEKPDIVEPIDCEGIDENIFSAREGSPRHFVEVKSPADIQQLLATIPSPFELEYEPATSLVSPPRSSTDEGLSRRETPTSSNLGGEAPVKICMKRRVRRVMQRVMAEFDTMFFGSPSGSVRHRSILPTWPFI